MDMRGGFAPPGQIEIATARRTATDEHGVVPFGEQRFERIDALAAAELHAEVEDVTGLLVNHRFRQAEARHLRAHEAAGLGIGVEHGDLVAERREIACHRQRGRTGADTGDTLAVRCAGFRQSRADIALEIGGDALEPADRHRFRLLAVVFLHAAAAAGRFARPIAGAAEDAGENVRFPVHQIGVVVTAGGDQADVVGHRRMRRTGPLAIDDLVEIIGNTDIGGTH